MSTKIKSSVKLNKLLLYRQEVLWFSLVLILSLALIGVRSSDNKPGQTGALPISSQTENSAKTSLSSKQNPKNQPGTNNTPSDKTIAETSQPSYEFRRQAQVKDDQIISKNGKTYPLRTYEPQAIPNDPNANQWWVAPTGISAAWDVPAGAKQVTTAVIDTGFALSHQEFSGRWAYNSSESGVTLQENPSRLNCTDRGLALNKSCNNIDDDFDGIVDNESGPTTFQHASTLNCTAQTKPLDKSCNMRDDDGNGLADDYLGWDFINFERSPQAGQTNPDGAGTTHGTMVSGVMAATGNNGVGIAGVNWHTKILPLQALDDDEYGNTYSVANAVYYAVDRGVDIINISLGTDFEDPFLREAILYAQEADVLIVASAGNDGCDCMVYPANYPEVIAVGASNSTGSVASFSSYGANLDITGPGQDMRAPYWTKTNGVSSYTSGAAGTSFSSPFVAGVFGLLRSQQPDASWDELAGTLFENSDRKTLSAASPRSNSYGFGFVKVDQPLNRTVNLFNPSIIYRFAGDILGPERIRGCEGSLIPGSFLHELSKSGQIRYTVNQYEIRKSVNAGWIANKLFGVCVGLPTDLPDTLRLISLNQEIRNRSIK